MKIHIFSNIIEHPDLPNDIDLHLWYDGQSNLFESFFDYHQPTHLYVEKTFLKKFEKLAIKHSIQSTKLIPLVEQSPKWNKNFCIERIHAHPSNDTHVKSF